MENVGHFIPSRGTKVPFFEFTFRKCNFVLVFILFFYNISHSVQELLRTKAASDYQDFMQWWDGEDGLFKEEKKFWDRADVVAHVDATAAQVDARAREKKAKKQAPALQEAAAVSRDEAGTSASAGRKRSTTLADTQAHPAVERVRAQELTDNDEVNAPTKALKEAPFSTPLKFCTSWPTSRAASRTISEGARVAFRYLDQPTVAFPTGFPTTELMFSSMPEREERWKDVFKLWEELQELRAGTPLDRRPRRELFVCHKGKAPAQRDAYNPHLHAEVNHIAIVVVDPRDTVGQRGWELVRIDSIDEDSGDELTRSCSVTYLVPGTSKCNPRAPWPDGWTNWKMGALCQIVDGDRVEWTDDLHLDCIMWSTPMRIQRNEAVMFLPASKKIQRPALECTKRIERVWANNQDIDAEGFFGMVGGIRAGLPLPTEREETDTVAQD
jgi:hypothetical protein